MEGEKWSKVGDFCKIKARTANANYCDVHTFNLAISNRYHVLSATEAHADPTNMPPSTRDPNICNDTAALTPNMADAVVECADAVGNDDTRNDHSVAPLQSITGDTFWTQYRIAKCLGDGHCFIHALAQSYNAQNTHECIDEAYIIDCINHEAHINSEIYTPFPENASTNDSIRGLHQYIFDKYYNTTNPPLDHTQLKTWRFQSTNVDRVMS